MEFVEPTANALNQGRGSSLANRRSASWLCALALLAGARGVVPKPALAETPRQPETSRLDEPREGRGQGPAATTQDADTAALREHDEAGTDSGGLRFFWKDTLRIESPDKNLRLEFGGRFLGDWAVFDTRHEIEDEIGDFEEGTEVRRARLYYSGTLFEHFEFKTQVELAERNIEAEDVFVGFLDLPAIGSLRLGHFKEPFGLNEATSSKYVTFMERSLTTETFAPGRNTGIMLRNTALGERMTWALGLFRETEEFFNGEISSGLHLTGRITALPWYEDGGRRLLHVGLAWSHQDPGSDSVGYGALPESNLAPGLADTGDLLADRVDLVGAEAALVLDSFSLQSEYIHAFVNRQDGGDLSLNSFYIQASYLFTGEHRHYNTRSAAFGRIRPDHDFGQAGGPGAWEAALRYSYLDLNDDDVRGGRMNDLTAGLNWYLNPNLRVSWNYVYSNAQDSGHANIFQMRLQLAF